MSRNIKYVYIYHWEGQSEVITRSNWPLEELEGDCIVAKIKVTIRTASLFIRVATAYQCN